MKLLLALFSFFIGCLAFANDPREPDVGGDIMGNGGDVLECDGKIELLDFYEASVVFRTPPALDDSKDLESNLRMVMDRLRRLDPTRAQRYDEAIQDFFASTRFLRGSKFEDINDSANIPLPSSCILKQIAIQREPEFPDEPIFFIDEGLWEKMASSQQAGLVLHEVIYRDALGHGHKNSRFVRYFNGVFASKAHEALTEESYQTLLQRFGMDAVKWDAGQRRAWTFSEEGFSDYQDAQEWCTRRGEDTVSREVVLENLVKLRVSLLGRYHIPSLGSLKFWVSNGLDEVMEMDRTSKPRMVPAEGSIPVLCLTRAD